MFEQRVETHLALGVLQGAHGDGADRRERLGVEVIASVMRLDARPARLAVLHLHQQRLRRNGKRGPAPFAHMRLDLQRCSLGATGQDLVDLQLGDLAAASVGNADASAPVRQRGRHLTDWRALFAAERQQRDPLDATDDEDFLGLGQRARRGQDQHQQALLCHTVLCEGKILQIRPSCCVAVENYLLSYFPNLNMALCSLPSASFTVRRRQVSAQAFSVFQT